MYRWSIFRWGLLCLFGATFSLPVSAASIESLIMPGKVIEGHKKYEDECSECHKVFGDKRQTQLCLDCHKKVAKDVNKKWGYHGRLKDIKNKECKSCHTEHKGRGADIVGLDKETFDHDQTDFVLKGQHEKIDCKSCHKPKKKYREASSDCAVCHKENPHKKRLDVLDKKEKACKNCHTGSTWNKIRYDHDKTKFKLTGEHRKTDCQSCHPNDRYKNTPKKCYSCHKLNDVHRGKNGKKCKKCHNTRDWKKLGFNHDKDTKFPLRGRHKKIKCYPCHKSNYKKELKKDCVACHKPDDEHKGRYGKKCKTCHSEKGWSKTKFNHDRDTDYPLRGKHKKTKCDDCHKGKNIYKENLKANCYQCHRVDDVHKGQQGKKCQRCHTERGWRKKVAFEHDLTRFPLIGLHAITPCEECHLTTAYQEAKIDCLSCHKEDDVHKQQLGKLCEQCHTPNGWLVWKFDHDKQTEFKLTGAHKEVHCHDCHRNAVDKVESDPRSCAACHGADDEHNGQFGSSCDRCHNTTDFKEIEMR